MRRVLLVLFLLAACLVHPPQAGAQTVQVWCNVSPNVPAWEPCSTQAYPFQSAGAGQYAVSITSVTTLTVPAGALIAEICVETASARYTTSGTTATSSTGIPVSSGGCFQLSGNAILKAFQIIGSGATMDVEYFK